MGTSAGTGNHGAIRDQRSLVINGRRVGKCDLFPGCADRTPEATKGILEEGGVVILVHSGPWQQRCVAQGRAAAHARLLVRACIAPSSNSDQPTTSTSSITNINNANTTTRTCASTNTKTTTNTSSPILVPVLVLVLDHYWYRCWYCYQC